MYDMRYMYIDKTTIFEMFSSTTLILGLMTGDMLSVEIKLNNYDNFSEALRNAKIKKKKKKKL